MTAGPPEVPPHVFSLCVGSMDGLETDAARAALIAGLFGYFLSCVPWRAERAWSEAILHLAREAAAVARNAEGADD